MYVSFIIFWQKKKHEFSAGSDALVLGTQNVYENLETPDNGRICIHQHATDISNQ